MVEQLTHQTVLRFKRGCRRAIMSVYEVKHIVALVCMLIVAVRQIDVCRIGTCYARAFGIIVRVVVNAHHFSPLFRLLLVIDRNGIGLVHQPRIVVWPIGSFRLFLLLIRR